MLGESVRTISPTSASSPESVIIFSSYERDDIAIASLKSLIAALRIHRGRVKVMVSDATGRLDKIAKLEACGPDDLIWTPHFTSAASSRNLAVTLLMDKYSPQYICFVEDDILYSDRWYPTILEATQKNYGQMSPWGMAYGVFSASPHPLFEEFRRKFDPQRNLVADIFGVAADQRFMPFHHYLTVFRMWDPDLLGVSSCQTGSQVHRNTMRGYCAGFLHNANVCTYVPGQESTWINQRDVGPPSHNTDIDKHRSIIQQAHRCFRQEGML
jgi:hypothetical protein